MSDLIAVLREGPPSDGYKIAFDACMDLLAKWSENYGGNGVAPGEAAAAFVCAATLAIDAIPAEITEEQAIAFMADNYRKTIAWHRELQAERAKEETKQ